MKYFAIDNIKMILFLSFSLFFSFGVNAQITSYPYVEDFESGWGQWTIAFNNATSWEIGVPNGSIINVASSGNNAWVTNLSGEYSDDEDGFLLSPIFDLSTITSPVVEFDLWWNCEYEYDGVVLQSSVDGQATWQNVGTVGSGTNWFNYIGIVSSPGGQLDGQAEGWSGRDFDATGSGGWVTVSQEINHLIGQTNVYFRLFFATDGSVVDEGIGFDLFKVYDDCTVSINTSAQDLIVQYDGNGNQVEVNNWLNDNGGAVVSCNGVDWSYEIINDNPFEDTLSVLIGFTAVDAFGNEAFTSANLVYEQFAFAGESTGTGGFLCGIESYNLGLITGLDPNAAKFQSSSFSTTQFDGPPGASISGIDIEFPDTGAGQFAYAFRVEIETEITIGDTDPLQYSSEAFLTVNNVTIPFDPGEDKTIFVCDASNVDLTALYDELDILVDVDESGFSFVTSNDFFPEDYWFDLDDNSISEITEAGTYKFNPRAFLPECGAEVTLVTIIEEEQLDAGDNVLDAVDDSDYSCGDTVTFNLNTYIDSSADLGGRWFDSNDNEISGGVIEFPDTGAGQFTKAFKYRQENEGCGFFSEADYEVTYDVGEFSVGTSTTFESCAGIIITEQDLIDELGADSGGFWSPPIGDISNVQPGIYFYSQGDCGVSGDSEIEVVEIPLEISSEAENLTVSYDGLGNQMVVNEWLNNNGGATSSDCGEFTWTWEIVENQLLFFGVFELATLQCTIQFNAVDQSTGEEVSTTAFLNFEDFPWAGGDIGTGGVLCAPPFYDLKQLSTLNFDSANFNSTNFTVSQTDGFPGVTSSGTTVEFPDTGAGQFYYRFNLVVSTNVPIGSETNVDVESSTFFTLSTVTVPFDPGPNITVEVCDASNIDLSELYAELEIILDVDTTIYNNATANGNVFEPENSWYRETDDLEANPDIQPLMEINEPGVYQFNAKKFLRDCAGEPVFVTIIEEVELFAGDDVMDAVDNSTYFCGDTVTLNLNTYIDGSADLGGRWFDSNDNEISGGVIEFPDTGAGNFTKSFKYRQENEVCAFFSEADYEVTYDVAEFSVGTSTTFNICAGITVTEEDLIDELGADSGGFWSPNIDDILNVQPGVYFYSQGDCGVSGDSEIEVIVNDCPIVIVSEVFLQGASIAPNVGEETLMRDDLRNLGFLPTTSPYLDGLTCNSSVFNSGGSSGSGSVDDDIVDWVYIELRDKNESSTVLYGRSALLQRDGSVVAEDGVSDISFLGVYDDYYVAIKHRNHLGVISSSLISFNESATIINFTNSSVSTLGSNSQAVLDSGVKALWAGDVNGDGQVRYLGPNNDTNFLKSIVVNEPGNDTNSNFYPFSGYNNSDVNLNGQIRYLGPNNDTNILKFIVLEHPSNTTLSNFFPFITQISN